MSRERQCSIIRKVCDRTAGFAVCEIESGMARLEEGGHHEWIHVMSRVDPFVYDQDPGHGLGLADDIAPTAEQRLA